MLYVTDTHPLVFFSTGKTRNLGKNARRIFREAEAGRSRIVIPVTVLEEVLRLNEDRRIRLPLPFPEMVARYEAGSSPFFVQDYTSEILCHAADYPTIRDPFDRVIVATAAALGYPLITHDGFLQDEAFVPTVW